MARSTVCAFVSLVIALSFCTGGCRRGIEQDYPLLTGDYLGQSPPESGAEIFAPGIVNRGLPCRDLTITPDGNEIIWSEQIGNHDLAVILRAKRIDGAWQPVETIPFSGHADWLDFEPFLSPDGARLFFVSNRPAREGQPVSEFNAIWVCEAGPQDWGDPVRLPDIINDGDTFFPSVTDDGTLYFTRTMPDRTSSIFRARFVDGAYHEPELLPEQVNAGRDRFNATVAADESFLIVPVYGLENAVGGVDYYLVRRNQDDSWQEPELLGEPLNSPATREWSLSFSPDQRYCFFMSDRPDTCLHFKGRLTPERLRDIHETPGTGQTGIWWLEATTVLATTKKNPA